MAALSPLTVFVARCVASSVAITTTGLPNGTVKAEYSAVVKASGGCTAYEWAIAAGALPAGVCPNGTTWKKINVSLIAWTFYSDSTVADRPTYYYAATAVDIHGRESVKTAAVKAVIPYSCAICASACPKNLNCGTCDYAEQLNSHSRVWTFFKGGELERSSGRVLVVEDSEPFRNFIRSVLGKRSDLQIVGEVTDGLEAVQKAEELKPDLILLDFGLPTLDGIEVARRVRTLSPESKILFVSQELTPAVVQGALTEGAKGYVLKTDARRELLTAVDAVLRGEQFVSRSFAGHDFLGASDARVFKDDPK